MRSVALFASLSTLMACGGAPAAPPHDPSVPPPSEPATPTAPLARWWNQPWTGPAGGVPPFDQVKVEDFAPAFAELMDGKRAAIRRITEQAAAPSFDNTVAALELAHAPLSRLETAYGVWSSSNSTKEFQAVQLELAPKLAAFDDEQVQNEALFARIKAVYDGREQAGLSAESLRLTERYYKNMVRAGAALAPQAKQRVAAINAELASLFTQFSQNVLFDEQEQALWLEREEQLAGLPEQVIKAAASSAEAKGKKGSWRLANTRSAVEPFLVYAKDRELRKAALSMFAERGDHDGAHDNKPVIAKIVALRLERAKLLGYPHHAAWRLEVAMARTPDAAAQLMQAVWGPAKEKVKDEVAQLTKLARKEGHKGAIEPHDYRYFAEKVRKATYDLDEGEVKQYLQLEKLREGMFFVAGKLLGLSFSPARGVPVYHPDVRVWEVHRHGKLAGLWYFDPYARDGKRSGAWMNAYRVQQRLGGETLPIVSNNANFVRGDDGQPVLISWSDARTLFHEFGHALHGLSSDVSYPTLAGTRVARDYVEFPSQLLEHWLSTPEVLGQFALHQTTGAPMPKALVDKLERAASFNQGFSTVEYLSAALLDLQLHTQTSALGDVAAFEKEALAALGMPKEMVMRHRLPQFLHLFSGDSYSAGYYSYLWSDVLTADAFGAFTEAGGPYDAKVAERLYKEVLSVGDTVDPAVGYRAFRGRDAEPSALMKKRGLREPSRGARN